MSGDGGQDPLEHVLLQLSELRDQFVLLEAARDRDVERLAALEAAAKEPPASKAYKPARSPRWWQLRGRERQSAIDRLSSWVDTVFRPGYGHLAAKVGPCWAQHDLCLYLLDWLSEMHAFLYHPADRNYGVLAGQGDWHTRFLLAAVAQMEEETHSCDHLRAEDAAAGDPWAGAP